METSKKLVTAFRLDTENGITKVKGYIRQRGRYQIMHSQPSGAGWVGYMGLNIFVTKKEATEYALKNIPKKITRLNKELKNCKKLLQGLKVS